MLSTSFEFREKIAQNSKTIFKAKLTLSDKTIKMLTSEEIMMGSATFSDAVSSNGSFDVGAAIINQFQVTLNNYDRQFDNYDFTNATIEPYVGVQLDNGGAEWLRKGIYLVDQPESYGNTIALTALDNMSKFERPYSEVTTEYPASLRTIVSDICRRCDVTLANADFANCNYSVENRPVDDALTCIEMISYAAQISGNYARVDTLGRLYIEWYKTDIFEREDQLDGESFDDDTPYSSGSDADGGTLDDYSSGDTYDGGDFGANSIVQIHAYSDATIITDDVVITGVRVTAQDEITEDGTDGSDGETVLFGESGYVLEIPNNVLVDFGKADLVARQIGLRVIGMRFRPFDISAVGSPAYEAGDPIIITDRFQNQYFSYITSLTYKVGNYQSLSCDAETPSRNSAASFSAATKALVKVRNELKKEKTAREKAIEDLAHKLGVASGLFMTKEQQPDGSYIYYMHDQPTLRESKIVWKLTAEAFGISTDGGETYPYGFDITGNAILNRIYAIGLDADFITTGAISIKSNQDTIFSADLDTKQVIISGNAVKIGTQSLTSAISGIRALYGTCVTQAATAEKVVVCDNFELREGSVVNVKFTYKNTADKSKLNVNRTGAKDIYINNALITSESYWNAQDILTFVYSNGRWNIVDAGTITRITAAKDAITASVAKTYATKSELKIGLESISLSVTNAALGQTASIKLSVNGQSTEQKIDMTNVRKAFANDTTAITISAGTITFNSNSFVVNSDKFKVTKAGVITATSGTIGGFTIKENYIFNNSVQLYNSGIRLIDYRNSKYIGGLSSVLGANGYATGINFYLTRSAGSYLMLIDNQPNDPKSSTDMGDWVFVYASKTFHYDYFKGQQFYFRRPVNFDEAVGFFRKVYTKGVPVSGRKYQDDFYKQKDGKTYTYDQGSGYHGFSTFTLKDNQGTNHTFRICNGLIV